MRRDLRMPMVLLVVIAVGGVGTLIRWWPEPQSRQQVTVASHPAGADSRGTRWDKNAHVREQKTREIGQRFQQAVMMLHAKQYDFAVAALHRVLELDPRLPEAHVNMGFALLGQEDYAAARDFFYSAIELRREQANAYFGLAVALEQECDIPGSIGAMRTFVHLAEADDPYVRKARSALWEWENGALDSACAKTGREGHGAG